MNFSFLNVDWTLGTNVTISGIVIVFSMLLLLVIVLKIFGSIFGTKNEIKQQVKEVVNVEKQSPVLQQSSNNDEIIAVISAAVAMLYEGTDVKPVVKAIKKVSTNIRPAWTSAGIYENTRPF